MYPTAEDRKANSYIAFRKNLRKLTLDDEGKNPHYEMEGTDLYSELYSASHPELPDLKQLFKQTIFKTGVVHENDDGTKNYDIEPMKLAEIYNKAMNRSYELLITAVVCNRMFGQTLHDIPSRPTRHKFLIKKVKKANREEARQQAIT